MFIRAVVVVCTFLALIPAQAKTKSRSTTGLMPGMGKVHHPVSTKNSQAQQFFDQGLALAYGFNHDEARRSFEQAAKLDPNLAMAWWGVALTLGPNYNLPVDLAREKAAFDAIQKAIASQNNASEPERAYINALAARYSDHPKPDLRQLDVAYRDAMAKLVRTYPDDLDAATLYAESMMNLNPWKLWSKDGKPAEGTEEIVAVLESVLKRKPNHLGANHYYVHAIEASSHPERGLASATRLEKLAPAAGHLVHMPSHIYARVGDHGASMHCNQVAADADKKYINAAKVQGVYPMMYYSHNLHFLAYAATMRGDFAAARDAAARLIANVEPHIKMMPPLEGFLPTTYLVLMAFEKWEGILKTPAPAPSQMITAAVWHFARGTAFAHLGQTAAAEKEQTLWKEAAAKVPPDTMYDELNKTGVVFKVHENILAAAIAHARHDEKATVDLLHGAIAAEDALNYSEPPAWYPPVRPLLGKVLFEQKKFAEAEKIFRDDLDRNPRNARALAGLRDCAKAQGRPYEADHLERQLRDALASIDAVSGAKR